MLRTELQPTALKDCVEDYLRQRGYSLRRAFCCLSPNHEDRHPSMHYNPRAKNVHCFACGATYDIFDLVGMDYGISDFSAQVEKVRELFGYAVPAADGPSVDSAPVDYFLARGVTAESCRKYGLYQREGRAYFPVEENGWCARAMDDSLKPRYKNAPGPLGIWNAARLSANGAGKLLFVTEGIVDAICLEQLGHMAISLCGSQNSGKLLRRCQTQATTAATWRFVACGDPDDAGHKLNTALMDGLSGQGIFCVTLPLKPEDGDIATLYQRDRARLMQLLECVDVPGQENLPASAADCVDLFFTETARRAAVGVVSTGFHSLDRLLDGGIHPGLYVVGAISSLGKTSFALQLADHVAENGTDVLFFSLEQSRYELIAKSLSRTSASLCDGHLEDAFTARQLLSGEAQKNVARSQLLHTVRQTYCRAATSLYIREGTADISIADIRETVGEHRQRTGSAPVVLVDYLQILPPADPRATDKQNTDRAVVELKRISRDFDIPVIAISSFNRENYRSTVSMESFKESGAVEYSADVLLGLQLQGAGSKDFDVNAEKSRHPRRVELVLLKNRNGIPFAKVPLQYYAKYSLFLEGRVPRKVL